MTERSARTIREILRRIDDWTLYACTPQPRRR
jgi:hypothetical protein